MRRLARRLLPEPLWRILRRVIYRLFPERLRRALRRVVYYGTAQQCPVCGSALKLFLPSGRPPRPNARCPVCRALGRHRFLWLFLQRQTTLLDGQPKRVLHFAPESSLERRLRRLVNIYVTADLSRRDVTASVDITAIQFPAASFDVVLCSHVLEHIPDDRTAMKELHRVLTTGGYAVIMVPISSATTDEDLTITDAAARERRFGQHDHVRLYGMDLRDRLTDAGFSVRCVSASEVVGAAETMRYGIVPSETIFLCQKSI